jgi:hypothetical protein
MSGTCVMMTRSVCDGNDSLVCSQKRGLLQVRQVSVKAVLAQQAYLLFYARTGSRAPTEPAAVSREAAPTAQVKPALVQRTESTMAKSAVPSFRPLSAGPVTAAPLAQKRHHDEEASMPKRVAVISSDSKAAKPIPAAVFGFPEDADIGRPATEDEEAAALAEQRRRRRELKLMKKARREQKRAEREQVEGSADHKQLGKKLGASALVESAKATMGDGAKDIEALFAPPRPAKRAEEQRSESGDSQRRAEEPVVKKGKVSKDGRVGAGGTDRAEVLKANALASLQSLARQLATGHSVEDEVAEARERASGREVKWNEGRKSASAAGPATTAGGVRGFALASQLRKQDFSRLGESGRGWRVFAMCADWEIGQ